MAPGQHKTRYPLAAEPQSAGEPCLPHGVGDGEFVAGEENRLAAWSVPALVEGDPAAAPLVVYYGPSGSGKSHLVRQQVSGWRKLHPKAKLEILAASEFLAQYVDAIATDRVGAWREGLAAAKLFVLEDLAPLAGKRGAQEQLCLLMDALLNAGGQMVVTCRWLPQAMPTLAGGLRSRLAEGLAVNVVLPGPAARRTLIERFASARGMKLSARAVQTLANGLEQPVPVLIGAVLRLEASAAAKNKPLAYAAHSVAAARETVAACAPDLSLRRVAAKTARYFGLSLTALKGPRRHQRLARARGVAMLLSRQMTPNSLRAIGEYFGRRDHATVRHACTQANARARRDPLTRQAVCDLRRQLLAE